MHLTLWEVVIKQYVNITTINCLAHYTIVEEKTIIIEANISKNY